MSILGALKGVNESVCKDVISTMCESCNFNEGVAYLHSIEDGLTALECVGIYISWCSINGAKIDEGVIKKWVNV